HNPEHYFPTTADSPSSGRRRGRHRRASGEYTPLAARFGICFTACGKGRASGSMMEPGVTCYMERVYPWIIGGLVLLLFVREVAWRLRMRRALREQAQQAVERSRSVLKGQIGEQ